MNELIAIGKELAELYAQREHGKTIEWQLGQEFDNRRMELYPQPDGYPGKNAEQRDAARHFVEAADETLTRIKDDQAAMKDKLSKVEAAIQSLEANRRALEWSIRASLINALAYKQIIISGDNGYAHEFDDVSDDRLIEEAEQLALEAEAVGEPYDHIATAEQAIAEVDAELEDETLAETMDYSTIPVETTPAPTFFDDELPL